MPSGMQSRLPRDRAHNRACGSPGGLPVARPAAGTATGRPQARTSSFQETAIPARACGLYGKRPRLRTGLASRAPAAELMLQAPSCGDSAMGPDRSRLGRAFRPDPPAYPVLRPAFRPAGPWPKSGRIGDPGASTRLALWSPKRLPMVIPLEYRNATTSDRVISPRNVRGLGPAGQTRSNPLATGIAQRGPVQGPGSGG